MQADGYNDRRSQIILVPGGPGLTARFYEELIDELGKRHTVLTVDGSAGAGRAGGDRRRNGADGDRRGNRAGGPDATPQEPRSTPQSVEEYARRLLEFLEREDREPGERLLIGHSFGVAVVLEALLAEEVPVNGLVLLNGFDSGEMLRRGLRNRRDGLPPAFHDGYGQVAAGSLEQLLPLLAEHFYPRHFCRLASWPDSLTEGMGSMDLDVATRFIGSDFFEVNGLLGSWDRSGDLHRLDIPALVIAGSHDYYLETDTLRLAENLPQGEAWISAESSHTPWLEDPDPFYRRLTAFLSTVG